MLDELFGRLHHQSRLKLIPGPAAPSSDQVLTQDLAMPSSPAQNPVTSDCFSRLPTEILLHILKDLTEEDAVTFSNVSRFLRAFMLPLLLQEQCRIFRQDSKLVLFQYPPYLLWTFLRAPADYFDDIKLLRVSCVGGLRRLLSDLRALSLFLRRGLVLDVLTLNFAQLERRWRETPKCGTYAWQAKRNVCKDIRRALVDVVDSALKSGSTSLTIMGGDWLLELFKNMMLFLDDFGVNSRLKNPVVLSLKSSLQGVLTSVISATANLRNTRTTIEERKVQDLTLKSELLFSPYFRSDVVDICTTSKLTKLSLIDVYGTNAFPVDLTLPSLTSFAFSGVPTTSEMLLFLSRHARGLEEISLSCTVARGPYVEWQNQRALLKGVHNSGFPKLARLSANPAVLEAFLHLPKQINGVPKSSPHLPSLQSITVLDIRSSSITHGYFGGSRYPMYGTFDAQFRCLSGELSELINHNRKYLKRENGYYVTPKKDPNASAIRWLPQLTFVNGAEDHLSTWVHERIDKQLKTITELHFDAHASKDKFTFSFFNSLRHFCALVPKVTKIRIRGADLNLGRLDVDYWNGFARACPRLKLVEIDGEVGQLQDLVRNGWV